MTVTAIPTDDTSIADDLLRGADAIALFVFGTAEEGDKRRVYYLAKSGGLPTFRLGKGGLCARKTTLRQWVEDREKPQ
jgi:hypothetical protein